MQVRIRRSPLYFTVPIALSAFSLLLLLWAIVQMNIPGPWRSTWPWRVNLLDIQSATTAATIAGGLVFARAQYEAAVRPMISWMGSIVKGEELSDRLVWLVRAVNGSSYPAIFHSLQYCVQLRRNDRGQAVEKDVQWVSHGEAISQIESAGLVRGADYELPESGQSFPLSISSQYHLQLALFTVEAMRIIEDVLIRVNATDQAGDTHERIIYCMRGAIRNPKGISIPFGA
jgi:hypothetical protein